MNNKEIDLTKKYYINPIYIIKPDKTKAVITNAKGVDLFKQSENENIGISWILNPVYAVMFSFFDGKSTLSETIANISLEIGIKEEDIFEMINSFIDNSKIQYIHYNKEQVEMNFSKPCVVFPIPKRFIIENLNNIPRKDLYHKDEFYIKKDVWDFEKFRLSSPTNITLMLNNQCVTDCIYCYANKKHLVNSPISTQKILELIDEANRMGVLQFELAGGEVLKHKDCYLILSHLIKNGYFTHVSTKVPLTEEQVIKLKETGIKEIQISLDAWNADILKNLLNVDDKYFSKMKTTLKLLEKHELKVSIKSVITSINQDIQTIRLLLSNLIKFKNIYKISVAPAEYSLYKEEKGFLDYRSDMQYWNVVVNFIRSFASKVQDVLIYPQGALGKEDIFNHVDFKNGTYQKRGLCSGNVTSLYILPDGKVTICEELYWHPKFIVGDITKQSIQEVWDSDEATKLYNLSQKDFRDTSACKHCPVFSECRLKLGVCWKMIFMAYGTEAWDLPDPRCPLAPPPINEFYR
jgi:radical SAM protein with 4Fe4S-binding SPASM domain